MFFWLRSRDDAALPVAYDAPAFALTDQSGAPFPSARLRGRVWVVDFVFTHCSSICPTLGSRMIELQEKFPELVAVSLTVDPDRDTPQRMKEYSEKYFKADPRRWIWLTGDKKELYSLMREGFKVTEPGPPTPEDIPHAPYLLLFDGRGRLRGTYAGTDRERFDVLLVDAARLLESERKLAPVRSLPAVNAGLNGTSGLLLLAGFLFIKRKNIVAHRACMVAACVSSLLFLGTYLTYHYFAGSTRFSGPPGVRTVYLAILISHTILAGLLVPLVPWTLSRALSGNVERHRAIAKWTFPIWLYVSITGVVVYIMLYQVYPAGGL